MQKRSEISELKTERTAMRLLRASDVSALYELTKKYPEIADTMTWTVPKKLEEAKRKFLKQNSRDAEDLFFGIFIKGEIQGRITVRNFHFKQQDAEKNSVFLSFWLNPEIQGKGYGTEVLKEVCRFCFKDMRLHKIFAGIFSENRASMGLLQKVGFREIGVLRKHYLKEGVFYDSVRFELLEEDFKM